jgi:hypothetical protein
MKTELFGLGFIGIDNVTVYVGVDKQKPNENEKEADRRKFSQAKLKLYNSGADAARLFPIGVKQ